MSDAIISKSNIMDINGQPVPQNPPVGVVRLYYNEQDDALVALDNDGNNILSIVTNLTVNGALTDSVGSTGTNQQVLSSTGSNIKWTNLDSIMASGAYTITVDDFLGTTTNSAITSATSFACDTNWTAVQIAGGTQSILSQNGTWQNPGQIIFTTAATSGDGVSLYKGGGSNSSGIFGTIGNNAPWQSDWWFELPSTITNYCIRIGFVKGGQQAADQPGEGIFLEYNTANTGKSDTLFELVTKSSSGTTYTPFGTLEPAASTWYHLCLASTTAGTIIGTMGVANGALGNSTGSITSNVDTSDAMMPIWQVIPRSAASITLVADRFSYIGTNGRI